LNANKPTIQQLLVPPTDKVKSISKNVREENKRTFKTQIKILII